MRELLREDVEAGLAQADLDGLDADECFDELKDIYINGFNGSPYCSYSDEELEDAWFDIFEEEIKIVDVIGKDDSRDD